MIEQPTQVRKPLVDDVLILALLVLDNAGVAVVIDAKSVHAPAGAGGVLAGQEVETQDLVEAALKDLLDISLQNLLAIDGSHGLNLLGRVLAHFK